MRIAGERTYIIKCVDRLLGLAESQKLAVKGYAVMVSGDTCSAFLRFAFGTDMEVVKQFCKDGQKCFREIILSVGTTGPDSKASAYPTIFIQRIKHIKRNGR